MTKTITTEKDKNMTTKKTNRTTQKQKPDNKKSKTLPGRLPALRPREPELHDAQGLRDGQEEARDHAEEGWVFFCCPFFGGPLLFFLLSGFVVG